METCVTILFGLNKVIARVERHVNVHDFSDRFFFSLSAFKISTDEKQNHWAREHAQNKR